MATAGQWSFNGGELGPRMRSRVDQERYSISVEEMVGWLPTLQGPAAAAPGTIFVEVAAGPSRLIPFEYNPTQGYVIEGSEGVLRFYTNDARIETSPGVAYEVAAPWDHDQLLALDYQQSADVLYLVGGGLKGRKLSRMSATTFSLGDLDLRNGPIGDPNVDQSVTVSASATTGSVTLTSSTGIFAETDVGSLFEIECADFGDIPSWEPGIDGNVAGTTKRNWAGKVYLAAAIATGGRTGGNPPSHDSGSEWDGSQLGTDVAGKGPYGVKWTFLYGRHGLLEITGYTSPTQVTATVVRTLADSLVTTPSWRWAFGAFSDTRGWPETVCEWNQCLVLTKGNRAYVGVVGDLENFERRDSSGDFQRDLAGTIALPSPARIVGCTGDGLLQLRTETHVYPVERLLVQSDTPGPPQFDIKKPIASGAASVKAIEAGGRTLFVQKAGRRLLEYDFEALRDSWKAPDATRYAEHIGKPGLIELAWQQEPERLVWAVRGDGTLAALAYDPDEQMLGWARRPLGGGMLARSICRITDPEGKLHQLWILAEVPPVEEEGDTEHWVLRMAPFREAGDAQENAFFVDAGLSHDGDPISSGSVPHLAGRTCHVLADGKPYPDIVVAADGGWEIGYEASVIHLGLGFEARLKTLRSDFGQDEGTAQGKLKHIPGLILRLNESQGLRVAVQGLDPYPIDTGTAADLMDTAIPLFTGDYAFNPIGGWDRDGQLTIERFQPTAAEIAAIIPNMEVGEQ